MSEYSDIKDFNYNATINKSITIKNGNDLKGATLEVVSDGVTLSSIQKANVTTQSSLKISSSSLSSLKIETVSSANASQVSGRGASDNAVNPPMVETDNTTVTSAVSVAIENAQIVAQTLTAGEINLAGMNTQLTLKDNESSIDKINTNTVCQVILEKGVGSTIPTTKEKINVTGNGELTQIDMTAVSDKKLIAFTPMSGVKSVVKKGSAIDFSDVVMLGTYRSEGSGIKVFRALSEGELIDTFSKLEKDFVVKIGDEETVVFKNGESKNSEFWVGLEAKTYSAYIVSEYQPQDAGCEYQFEITVLDIDGDDDDLPEFELKSIEVQTGSAKTEYTVGEVLDLRRLLVLGNYEQGKYSYNGIITDYTLDPQNGTPLTTAGTQNVTVTAEGKTKTIEIIVKEAKQQIKRYVIQFNSNGGEGTMANQDMTYDVSADLPANAFTKDGCLFVGWALSADGEMVYTNEQEVKDLTTDNVAEVTLYAIWKEKSSISVGNIMYSDMTFSSEYVAGKTPIGIVFEVGTKVKIVHLSEQSSLKWCLDTADGYNCNPATSTSDGSGNWQIICDAVSDETTDGNYPAFEYVNGLGSGWYLPAKDELNAVYTNKADINAALTKLINAEVSATLLKTALYWSSSSINTSSAWYQYFSSGGQCDDGKNCHYSVRAVRAF